AGAGASAFGWAGASALGCSGGGASAVCSFALQPKNKVPTTAAAANHFARFISQRSLCIRLKSLSLVLLPTIQLAADSLDLRHNTQSIFTENFLYFTLRVAFFQQSFGNLRQFCSAFHSIAPITAVQLVNQHTMIEP